MSLTDLATSNIAKTPINSYIVRICRYIPGEAVVLYAIGIAFARANLHLKATDFNNPAIVIWTCVCILFCIIWVPTVRSSTIKSEPNVARDKLQFPFWGIAAAILAFTVYGVGIDHVWAGGNPVTWSFLLLFVLPLLEFLNQIVAMRFPGQEL